jgi:ABC-type uncharacterized transport system ATPase subunit
VAVFVEKTVTARVERLPDIAKAVMLDGGKPGQIQGRSEVDGDIVFSAGIETCLHVRSDLEASPVRSTAQYLAADAMVGLADISGSITAHAPDAHELAAGASPQALLDVRGLSVTFKTSEGELPVTRDISFSVTPGERVGIVGESGCGKTVTDLSLLRLLPSRSVRLSGQILFESRDLAKLSAREMRAVRGREIAMIFQEPMSTLDPEDVAVFIELVEGERLSEDELRDHTRHVMPKYMQPTHIRFVPALPVTPTNKVEKYKLKRQILDELNSSAR